MATSFISAFALAQVSKTVPVKNKTVAAKLVPAPVAPESVYTITAARVTVKTGNDNKEQPSKVFVSVGENDGIWGKGRQLFYPQNNDYKSEIKINSLFEFPLAKYESTTADAFTLTNLQAKGLSFTIYYMPNFSLDAWKIESVSLQLEFKDQFGRVHPTYGSFKVQYAVPNGLLTNPKVVMVGKTDKFLMSQGVIIGQTQDFW